MNGSNGGPRNGRTSDGAVRDSDLRQRDRLGERPGGNGGPDSQGHADFAAANGAALRGGDALQPTATATSIRHDSSGEVTVTDGAFAETKEALGGFYLIEAGDLDAAIASPSRSRWWRVASRSGR